MRAASVIAFGTVAGLAFVALASTTIAPWTPIGVTNLDGTIPEGGPDDTGLFDSPALDGGGSDATTSCSPSSFGPVCQEAGANGCAGFGGEGGVGGQGGGAAIALYVIGNSHVTVSNGAFFVAHGGAGGAGGDGGTGSTGHDGVSGAPAQCCNSCDQKCQPTGGYFVDGGAGGNGGPGGSGGLGGGGAGGPIYFYAYIDAAAPSITPSTLTGSMIVADGGPGQGGTPNGKPGAQGVSFP